MLALPTNNEQWWYPKKGFGEWKVQVNHLRDDFGLCVNEVTGEHKQWPQLKPELYGPGWDEVVRETTEYGANRD